jgi:serine/threonine-protein kinase
MSPEQLRGGELDPRSDLFSVGVVLYEMLTHKLPFDVPTPMEMLHKHLSDTISPPSERSGRRISPDLEDVVMQALSASQRDRPASAEAMREALLRAVPISSREARPRPATGSGAARSRESARPVQRPTPRDPTPAQHSTPAHRASATPPHPRRDGAFDPAVLERARRDLAPYIGPLARIIVRRVCDRARDVRDLYELLALEIPTESERERFRHLAPQDSASTH